MKLLKAMELIKKYSICPQCGNDKVGGKPSAGTLNVGEKEFYRSCKCGWSITVGVEDD